MRAARLRGACVAGLLVAACTLGVRARGAFRSEVDLAGAHAVMLDLPSTPIVVRGCDGQVAESCPDALAIEGQWHATGASKRAAERNAETPSLEVRRHEGLVRVSADIPLEVAGLVDLALESASLPSDVDLEVRTSLGDVEVRDMSGSVLVDVEVGDVDVRGSMRSTGVRVEDGQVRIEGSGAVDVRAEQGGVRVEQTAGAANAVIDAPEGDVVLLLGDDLDMDLRIETPGRIRVQTDAFAASTRGLYRARSGTGTHTVEIDAGGDVTVRLRG